MKLFEIIEKIYKDVIPKLDFSKDDFQEEICLNLDETYTYSIIVLFDVDLRPSLHIEHLDILDKNEKPINANTKQIEAILEQKFNLYYDYLKKMSHENY